MKRFNYLALAVLLVFASCEQKKQEETNKAEPVIAEVQQEYAPDSRVALFDVEAVENGDHYVLKGETNMPEAVSSLKEKLQAENVDFTDSISVLPDTNGLEGKTLGVIRNSVANLRDEPHHSAQLVTQATLGMPVKVYKVDNGNWYYVQTPDGYLAWVDGGGIENMSSEEFKNWKSTEKLIYLKPYGAGYAEAKSDAQVVSDLVAGDVLELVNDQKKFFEVKYPDGRKAFIKKDEAKPYKEWLNSLDSSGESLVKTSKTLMGLPYLWGGTSPKGVDCSGFTKTVYFLNGMVIPRDASQQVFAGKLVDSTKNFENLIPGDLLFFGRPATDSTKEKVVHVGMWIGDNRFIHSMGNVHISTMDTTAEDFDEYNYNRYLRSKRILNQESDGLLYLRKKELFTADSTSAGN
ncbi:MAG: SH3 domain-containing C40 family peptidase [Salegentibacter sp.]